MAGLTNRPLVPAFVRIAAASALVSGVGACGGDDGTGNESQGSNATDTAPEGPAMSGSLSETSAGTMSATSSGTMDATSMEESAGSMNATDTSPEGPCPPSECTFTSTGPTGSGDTGSGTDTDTDTDASSGSGSSSSTG